MSNKELTWETTTQYNLGLDFGFFNNRISGSIDIYKAETRDILMNYKDLTVITNALNIALILGENHGINLIVTGGEFKAPTLSLTGKMAADSFKDIRANKLFLATAGISSDMKLTYPSLSDLVVKSAMIESASKVYLVADCSKIGVSALDVYKRQGYHSV